MPWKGTEKDRCRPVCRCQGQTQDGREHTHNNRCSSDGCDNQEIEVRRWRSTGGRRLHVPCIDLHPRHEGCKQSDGSPGPRTPSGRVNGVLARGFLALSFASWVLAPGCVHSKLGTTTTIINAHTHHVCILHRQPAGSLPTQHNNVFVLQKKSSAWPKRSGICTIVVLEAHARVHGPCACCNAQGHDSCVDLEGGVKAGYPLPVSCQRSRARGEEHLSGHP